VRRHDRAVPHPIGARRLADDLPERSAERPQASETDSKADVGDSAVSLTQQKHRALDPPPLQIAMGHLAEDRAEAAAEVGRRDVGHRSHGAHVERPGIVAIHRVSGTQQAPIEIFSFAAHRER
jgi:hypothetical protein